MAADGVELIKLAIEKGTCEAEWSNNVLVSDSLAICNINFDYEVKTERVAQESDSGMDNLHTVSMEFVDNEGVVYSTEDIIKESWSKFRVVDVSDYTEPLLGNDFLSKKIEVEFDVKLQSKEGQTIAIRGANGVFPMGRY